MSIKLNHNYLEHLADAKPIELGEAHVHPPPGALGAPTVVPPMTIPPVNTDIRFDMLSSVSESDIHGLADISEEQIPVNFNWIDNGGKKSRFITRSGNQMLCGSCWAIASANLIADNFVVSGIGQEKEPYEPELSTTYCLACYPQKQCKGGNPALLLQNIHESGIATKSCIDYSWCATNGNCNGKATHHFKEGHEVNLSTMIPPCGCYDSSKKHAKFYIEEPKKISMNKNPQARFELYVKKHILKYGPVLGGFFVFGNFMHGTFTHVNGGIYLENGIYDQGPVRFTEDGKPHGNYVGSHAVEIIGWGVQDDVVVDNNGTKKSVPYWECMNSWTTKWGNNGRFRMAMYPFNKLSQFDKIVTIQQPGYQLIAGGIILVKAKQIKMEKLPQLPASWKNMPKIHDKHPNNFYHGEYKNITGTPDKDKYDFSKPGNLVKGILGILLIVIILIVVFKLIRSLIKA